MRIPKFLTEMAASVLNTLAGFITKPRITREAAFCVDLSIGAALATMPGVYGWALFALFFMLRDATDTKRFGPGKRLYKLKILNAGSGNPVGWRMTIVRNMILAIFPLNVADIAHFIRTGRRLTDEWFGIEVRQQEMEDETTGEKVEDYPNPPTTE